MANKPEPTKPIGRTLYRIVSKAVWRRHHIGAGQQSSYQKASCVGMRARRGLTNCRAGWHIP